VFKSRSYHLIQLEFLLACSEFQDCESCSFGEFGYECSHCPVGSYLDLSNTQCSRKIQSFKHLLI